MPIYTYRCSKCGKVLDVNQSFSDDPLKDCPECLAKDALKKVYSAATVIYKGSGYYCTDNPHAAGCGCDSCKKK